MTHYQYYRNYFGWVGVAIYTGDADKYWVAQTRLSAFGITEKRSTLAAGIWLPTVTLWDALLGAYS